MVDTLRSPLPVPRSSLVGRQAEIAAARALILDEGVALLTLTGPGGVGKTRVALAAAAAMADAFAGGAVFVDLSPIRDADLVLSAVARALGVNESGDHPLHEVLAAFLRSRRLLLILDNCEQVIDAAPAIAALLRGCPALHVLATSRAPLHIQGEYELAIPPLTLPATDDVPAAVLAQAEAVALFLQRARAVNHDFAPTEDDTRAIAAVCRRVDGLPLAIELAAVRLKVLSPRALEARLGDRLHLLSGDARDAPDRQRTVRATIAWSVDLLTPQEQSLLRQLAVFRGGFSLPAAAAVAGEPPVAACVAVPNAVFEGIASLLDKNLLRRQDAVGGEDRFGMLETVQDFALSQLAESGDVETIRRRHAMWCLELAEWAEAAAWTEEQPRRLTRLAADYDNVRAALAWSLAVGEVTIGVRLASAMAQFWYIRGPLNEGHEWLERALQIAIPESAPALRPKVLFATGLVAARKQDLPRSNALLGESLERWQASGSTRGEAEAVFFLALNREIQDIRGDSSGSLPLLARALDLFRELDHPLMRHALLNLGWVAHKCGDDARALPLLEEAHALYERHHDEWGLGISLDRRARVAQDRGEAAHAATLAASGLRAFRHQGDQAGMLDALLCIAGAAAVLGIPEPACRLLGAIERLPDIVGVAPDVDFVSRYHAGVGAVRSILGKRRTADLLVTGQAMSLDQAVDDALALVETLATGDKRPTEPPAAAGSLSTREQEVLHLIAAGQTNAEIAAALFIAPRTVSTHASHILNKLGLASRGELIAYAHREGLV